MAEQVETVETPTHSERSKKRSKEQVLSVIKKANGNRGFILKALEVSARTFSRYLAEWDECKQAYHDSRHKRQLDMCSMAETNLWNALSQGDVHTSRWYLTNTRIGRAMGYGNAMELTGKDGRALMPNTGFKVEVDDSPISSKDD